MSKYVLRRFIGCLYSIDYHKYYSIIILQGKITILLTYDKSNEPELFRIY